MVNLQKALLDPASEFKRPKDVLLSDKINRADKINILRRWVYDLNEISVAEEENMQGEDKIGETIDEIIAALHILHGQVDTEHTPPTKQGGLVSPKDLEKDN